MRLIIEYIFRHSIALFRLDIGRIAHDEIVAGVRSQETGVRRNVKGVLSLKAHFGTKDLGILLGDA